MSVADKSSDSQETADSQTTYDKDPSAPDNGAEWGSDASLAKTIKSFSELLSTGQEQLQAQYRVVAAEVVLLKKSVIVLVLALLTAFMLCSCAWLVINIGAAVLLSEAGLATSIITLIILSLNLVLAYVAFGVAKQAYRSFSLTSLLKSLVGKIPGPPSED
jgi:uncharacterized phage infection (PIP) family protein YhgE